MMEENSDGQMEFPRDVIMQDCFSGMQEPLFGFVTNVTLVNDSPCILDVECFENGTKIRGNETIQNEDFNSDPMEEQTRRQGKPYKPSIAVYCLNVYAINFLSGACIIFCKTEYAYIIIAFYGNR